MKKYLKVKVWEEKVVIPTYEISVPEQFDFIVSGFWGIIMHTVKYFKPAKKWREALPPGKTQ